MPDLGCGVTPPGDGLVSAQLDRRLYSGEQRAIKNASRALLVGAKQS